MEELLLLFLVLSPTFARANGDPLYAPQRAASAADKNEDLFKLSPSLLLERYAAGSVRLREKVRGEEEELVVAQNGEKLPRNDREEDDETAQTSRSENFCFLFIGGSREESDGSGSPGASGGQLPKESSGIRSSASGEDGSGGAVENTSRGSGDGDSESGSSGSGDVEGDSGSGGEEEDSPSPSVEEILREWLLGELVRMTTVAYDCKSWSETVGDWRNETSHVTEWLISGKSESHTGDSHSVVGSASGSGSESFIPGETLRDKRFIFGEDNREFVTQSENFPECAVARVSTGCTSFFIGPYHALTAAHCVNNFRYGWRGRVRLWRERNCHDRGYLSTCTRIFAVFGHTHLKLFEYDYALIETDKPSPCWFGIGFENPWDHPSTRHLEVLGYPYDKRRYTGQPECTYEAMWQANCNVSYSMHQHLVQWCDALSGNSGSPVYSVTDSQQVVYGIHAQSVGQYVYSEDGGRELEYLWNQGPMITPLRYHQILRWMKGH